MIWQTYLLVLGSVVVAQLSPGPNLVAVASTGLAEGRARSLMVVLGVSSGMLVWSAATALGLGTVLEIAPYTLTVLKFLGGAYLLWMGWGALKATLRGAGSMISGQGHDLTLPRAWRRGFLVVLTNPKAGLMWAALATFLFGAGLSPLQVMVFGPVGALTGLIIYGGYAILFSSNIAMRGYSRFGRLFEGVFAAAFGLLGGKLIWDAMREIRA